MRIDAELAVMRSCLAAVFDAFPTQSCIFYLSEKIVKTLILLYFHCEA